MGKANPVGGLQKGKFLSGETGKKNEYVKQIISDTAICIEDRTVAGEACGGWAERTFWLRWRGGPL